jgi:hypothetical protein
MISPLGVPGRVAEAANLLVAAPQVIEAEKNQPAMHVRLWHLADINGGSEHVCS